jgi:hypothetical protein
MSETTTGNGFRQWFEITHRASVGSDGSVQLVAVVEGFWQNDGEPVELIHDDVTVLVDVPGGPATAPAVDQFGEHVDAAEVAEYVRRLLAPIGFEVGAPVPYEGREVESVFEAWPAG